MSAVRKQWKAAVGEKTLTHWSLFPGTVILSCHGDKMHRPTETVWGLIHLYGIVIGLQEILLSNDCFFVCFSQLFKWTKEEQCSHFLEINTTELCNHLLLDRKSLPAKVGSSKSDHEKKKIKIVARCKTVASFLHESHVSHLQLHNVHLLTLLLKMHGR